MSTTNVTNPGSVNVADQSDGEIKVNQTITVSPSTNAGPTTRGGDLAPGRGVSSTDPSDVSPPMTALRNVDGGTASPTRPDTINTSPDTVVGQPSSVQQYCRTTNVYV
jgi:hypothetical protein